jgi:hypothetical protein
MKCRRIRRPTTAEGIRFIRWAFHEIAQRSLAAAQQNAQLRFQYAGHMGDFRIRMPAHHKERRTDRVGQYDRMSAG